MEACTDCGRVRECEVHHDWSQELNHPLCGGCGDRHDELFAGYVDGDKAACEVELVYWLVRKIRQAPDDHEAVRRLQEAIESGCIGELNDLEWEGPSSTGV